MLQRDPGFPRLLRDARRFLARRRLVITFQLLEVIPYLYDAALVKCYVESDTCSFNRLLRGYDVNF